VAGVVRGHGHRRSAAAVVFREGERRRSTHRRGAARARAAVARVAEPRARVALRRPRRRAAAHAGFRDTRLINAARAPRTNLPRGAAAACRRRRRKTARALGRDRRRNCLLDAPAARVGRECHVRHAHVRIRADHAKAEEPERQIRLARAVARTRGGGAERRAVASNDARPVERDVALHARRRP